MQAIESSDVPLAYQLEGSGLVSALPYIDAVPDKSEYRHVKRLILEEAEADKNSHSNLLGFESLTQDIHTPTLDRLQEELLGKRQTSVDVNGTSNHATKSEKPRGEYERTIIEIEHMKDRFVFTHEG